MPIPANTKLVVTLKYLATGKSFETLSHQFRIHSTTIRLFIPEVCKSIFEVLKNDCLSLPQNEQDWIELADKTYQRWQFPNAFGAADGKHVAIFHPYGSGSDFYNY